MDCMQLLFFKGGSHGWRNVHRIEGKGRLLSLGTHPDPWLAAARRKAEAAREWVAEGNEPEQLDRDGSAAPVATTLQGSPMKPTAK